MQMPGKYLTLSDGRGFRDPDEKTLGRLLRECSSDSEFFAILEQGPNNFMQTAGCVADGFALEYQDGGLHHHNRCIDESLELGDVTLALTLYLRDDVRWRTKFDWQPCDLRKERRTGHLAVAVIVALLIIGLFLVIRSGG
jgi:hypothetical protein